MNKIQIICCDFQIVRSHKGNRIWRYSVYLASCTRKRQTHIQEMIFLIVILFCWKGHWKLQTGQLWAKTNLEVAAKFFCKNLNMTSNERSRSLKSRENAYWVVSRSNFAKAKFWSNVCGEIGGFQISDLSFYKM